MNEDDKLRQAIKAYWDTWATRSEAIKVEKAAGVGHERARTELARIIHALGGKAVISGGRRFSLAGDSHLQVDRCEDRVLDP